MNYLYMNASVAAIILVTLLIRRIAINKIPHCVFSLLWELAVIRMLIPFNIKSDWCIFNIFFELRDFLFAKEVISLKLKSRQIQQLISNRSDINITIKIIIVIWILGIIVVGGYFAMSYLTGKRLIRNSSNCSSIDEQKFKQWLMQYDLPADIKVRVSDEIDVPLAYGCFNPGILIPDKFHTRHESNAKQIMLHECMHIKKNHALIKLLLAILVCSCWFNPSAWVLFKYIKRDMEISCDIHVLELLGSEQRESYALNLLSASQMQYNDSIVFSGFAKNSIKERIVAIMKFKKMSVFAFGLSMLLPVGVATVFATTDNRLDGSKVSDIEIVTQEDDRLKNNGETVLTFIESELKMYVDKGEIAGAARNIYIDDYEYITTSMPPEKITVKFTISGYTNKGTLYLYEVENKSGKYYGYYDGWTTRV
ncbi:M56 family metallopeptidase [Anaerotignum sp.]|uniref:M56 family metallopeptidase n=1 Tax=Anaerotignum sp. TaxID=2039241 RepID=UPI0028B0F667|nr:M56 family metallopeptidase [Anaerotignum sp.]